MKYFTRDSKIDSYYQEPTFLFEGPKLQPIDIVVYTQLHNRARISQKNENFIDNKGRVFVYYTEKKLAKDLSVCTRTIQNSFIRLVASDYIEIVPQYCQKPNIIYVKIK